MAVYFVQDGGPGGHIKIGFTAGNPHSRIAQFRTGNPRPLTLLASIPGGEAEEKALHKRFESLRESGEWFRSDPRLLGFIQGMLFAHPEQPSDPGPQPTICGLTPDQIRLVSGYVEARRLEGTASDLLEAVGGDPTADDFLPLALSARDLCAITVMLDKLSSTLRRIEAGESWVDIGAGLDARGPTIRYYLECLQGILDRHHEELGRQVAELRAADPDIHTDPFAEPGASQEPDVSATEEEIPF
jgi:hypothetical protein